MTTAAIRDALTSDPLWTGFALGAIGLVVVLLLARWRVAAGREGPAPIAGVLLVVAAAIALPDSMSLPAGVLFGLVLLALAGQLAKGSVLFGMLLALPGAVLLVLEGPNGPWWVSVALVVSATIGSVAVGSFDRQYARLGSGPVLFGLSAAGVYLTIPETDVALTIVGVAVPLALAGWPLMIARLGDAGAFASVGFLSWVTVTGGIGRSSAVIGGLACLGVLAAEPASRALLVGRASDRCLTTSAAVAVHVVVVLLVARLAGRLTSTADALLITSAVLGSTVVGMACWMRWPRRPG